jgi:hypothetical protein
VQVSRIVNKQLPSSSSSPHFLDSIRLYAASSYLKRIGAPKSVEDLNQADFIGFDKTDRLLNAINALGLNLTQKTFDI